MKSSLRMLRRALAAGLLFSLMAQPIPAFGAWAPPQQGPTEGNPSGPLTTGSSSQGRTGGLRIGGSPASTPHAKAILELDGVDPAGGTAHMGALPPRLNTQQRQNLQSDGTANSAIKGLTIYNTTLNRYEVFDGLNWAAIATSSLTQAYSPDGPAFTATYNISTYSLLTNNVTYKLPFDALRGTNPNTDPCVGVCPAGPWGFITSGPNTGSFRPSVPGKYLLTVSVIWNIPVGQSIDISFYKNGAQLTSIARDAEAGTHTYTYADIVDAVAGDYFDARVIPAGGGQVSLYRNTAQSYFAGSRIGNPVTVNLNIVNQNINVPTGAVMFYDLSQCPGGWRKADGIPYQGVHTADLRGRYPVGLQDGYEGQYGVKIGNALSYGQNRVVGQHGHGDTGHGHGDTGHAHNDDGHAHNDAGHAHSSSFSGSGTITNLTYDGVNYNTFRRTGTITGDGAHPLHPTSGNDARIGGSVDVSGSPAISTGYAQIGTGYARVANGYAQISPGYASIPWSNAITLQPNVGYSVDNGTNAPYTYLLACQKN